MMGFTNAEQLRLLLQSVLLGVGVGLLYDALRALRRHFACGRAATAVYDAVFWLVVAAALFEFGIVFAIGQNRFFALAGVAGGMVMYFMLLSDAVLAVLGGALGAAARIWLFICAAMTQTKRDWCHLVFKDYFTDSLV